MARRLLAAGFPLAVYNRNPQKSAALAAAGARVAATPADAATGAQIIFSMVADDAASRSVWLGEHGALPAAARGAVLVESSTLSIRWVKELAAAASAQGCQLLDAPVTGSKVQAATGELLFLVGGSADALETARPAFQAMGRAVRHLGPTGSGAMLKLINNFVCGVQIASLAEGLALIERSGLDRELALDVLKNGAPGSPLFRLIADRMTARDFTPNFLLRLMSKDLAYAVAEAEQRSLDLMTASAALQRFQQALAAGHGDKDMSALIELLLPSR